MLAAQLRELRGTFGPKKPRNAGLRSVSDMCVSAARRLVRRFNMCAARKHRGCAVDDGLRRRDFSRSRGAQYGLVKGYTLNHIREPIV